MSSASTDEIEVTYEEKDDIVRITKSEFGIKWHHIPLNILPDPVDDTDSEYDIFVKPYSLWNKKEPSSYNQEGKGLEYHYPYIKRLRVTGAVKKSINQVMEDKEE